MDSGENGRGAQEHYNEHSHHELAGSTRVIWRERFIQAGKSELAGARSSREEELEKEQLKGVIGELTLTNAIFFTLAPEERRAVKEMSKEGIETAHACEYASIPRSTDYYGARSRLQRDIDSKVSSLARIVGERYPTSGYRRLAAVVSKDAQKPVNRKKMRRILAKLNLLQAPPKRIPHLTRTRESQTAQSRLGDMTKVRCGADGWGYLLAVVDTCTREWVGYAFSPFCRAKEAFYSVEMAVQRKYPEAWKADGVTLRTENGPQYTARSFGANLKTLGINHERARYRTPEDIGVIESLHKNLKRDHLWLYDFENFQEAEQVILNAFDYYNQIRPHSSLGYKSPLEYLREVEQCIVKKL